MTTITKFFTNALEKKTGTPHTLHVAYEQILTLGIVHQKRGGKRRAHSLQSPLEDFFAKYYPEFDYDATASASHEFYRLCDELDWDSGDPEREDAHREFKNTLVKQFNEIYGTDEDDLGEWQNLCHIVDIDPIPDDLESCREASTILLYDRTLIHNHWRH